MNAQMLSQFSDKQLRVIFCSMHTLAECTKNAVQDGADVPFHIIEDVATALPLLIEIQDERKRREQKMQEESKDQLQFKFSTN